METSAANSTNRSSENGLSPEAEQRREMALRHVRQYPDPVLRRATVDVTTFDDELVALVERMTSIMRDAYGIGLAAPQLGLRQRLFTHLVTADDVPEAVINPVITRASDDTDIDDEGCLSLGDSLRVPVRRSLSITVEGKTIDGDDKTWELDGYAARVFQHEIDHLDGVLMIDRIDDPDVKAAALAQLRPRP